MKPELGFKIFDVPPYRLTIFDGKSVEASIEFATKQEMIDRLEALLDLIKDTQF